MFKEKQTASLLPLGSNSSLLAWGAGRAVVPAASDKTGLASGGQWAARDLGDAVEGSAPVSWRADGGAVSKGRRLHLASWLSQQFLQEV